MSSQTDDQGAWRLTVDQQSLRGRQKGLEVGSRLDADGFRHRVAGGWWVVVCEVGGCVRYGSLGQHQSKVPLGAARGFLTCLLTCSYTIRLDVCDLLSISTYLNTRGQQAGAKANAKTKVKNAALIYGFPTWPFHHTQRKRRTQGHRLHLADYLIYP